MPGRVDEEEQNRIESQAKESQKKGLSARLEEVSHRGKLDDETIRRAWNAKKGGGAEGGASRSVGSSQPKDTQAEEEAKTKQRENEAAAEKEKETERVKNETRGHELDRYYQQQRER